MKSTFLPIWPCSWAVRTASVCISPDPPCLKRAVEPNTRTDSIIGKYLSKYADCLADTSKPSGE